MKLTNKHFAKMLLASPALLFTILFLFALNKKTDKLAVQKFVKDNLEEWRKLDYLPITDNVEFRKEIDKLVIQSQGKIIGNEQETRLHEAIYNFLMAFNNGNYEAYRQFRTPSLEFHFETQKLSYFRYYLTNYSGISAGALPEDPFQLDKMMWENKYGKDSFVNYFKGISIASCSITLEQAAAVPRSLLEFAKPLKNAGFVNIGPTYIFERSPEIILKQDKILKYVTFSATIQRSEPDPPTPVYVRYYWDASSQKWLPWQFVTTNILKRAKDPIF